MSDSTLIRDSRGLCPSDYLEETIRVLISSSHSDSLAFTDSHARDQSVSLFESTGLVLIGDPVSSEKADTLLPEARGEGAIIVTSATIAVGTIGAVLALAAATIGSFLLFCRGKKQIYSTMDVVSEMDDEHATSDQLMDAFDSGRIAGYSYDQPLEAASGDNVLAFSLEMEENGFW
jgi:hypothetical protein